MNKTTIFFALNSDKNLRLDKFLTNKLKILTRSQIKRIIESKGVKIDKEIVVAASEKIKKGNKVEVFLKLKKNTYVKPTKIKLNIVHEDKDIIIVNKPSGLTVHPGAGNFENTLANALVYKYKKNLSNINDDLRPGIVHRIDKDTSGLLVIAKNNLSHSNLGKQFSDHTIKRKYLCLAWGIIRPLSGRIETLISRNKKNRQLMTVSDINGKKAITNYKTIKVFDIKEIPKVSLIECELETGRTHQIRVHLKYKGASLLGDKQYGKKNIKFRKTNEEFFNILTTLDGQVLHAQTLEFIHPATKKWVSFKSDLPKEFKKMLNLLNNLSG
jgi:23S rRNA pseudouridine1911/1915/1917 synthase